MYWSPNHLYNTRPTLGGERRSSLDARVVDARARTTHTDRERETPYSSLFVPAFHASFLFTPPLRRGRERRSIRHRRSRVRSVEGCVTTETDGKDVVPSRFQGERAQEGVQEGDRCG